MDDIKLTNRYDTNVFLKPICNGLYTLCFDDESEYDYCRIATEKDGTIVSVDPSGGPFMTIGYELANGEKVTSFFEFDAQGDGRTYIAVQTDASEEIVECK